MVALDGTEVVTIGVVDGWRSVRMHGAVGKRSPAHATATGKALLSGRTDDELRARYAGARRLQSRTPQHVRPRWRRCSRALAEIRVRGCALDAEELEIGLRCVAAPVVDHAGSVVAAVGLSGPADRFYAGGAGRRRPQGGGGTRLRRPGRAGLARVGGRRRAQRPLGRAARRPRPRWPAATPPRTRIGTAGLRADRARRDGVAGARRDLPARHAALGRPRRRRASRLGSLRSAAGCRLSR